MARRVPLHATGSLFFPSPRTQYTVYLSKNTGPDPRECIPYMYLTSLSLSLSLRGVCVCGPFATGASTRASAVHETPPRGSFPLCSPSCPSACPLPLRAVRRLTHAYPRVFALHCSTALPSHPSSNRAPSLPAPAPAPFLACRATRVELTAACPPTPTVHRRAMSYIHSLSRLTTSWPPSSSSSSPSSSASSSSSSAPASSSRVCRTDGSLSFGNSTFNDTLPACTMLSVQPREGCPPYSLTALYSYDDGTGATMYGQRRLASDIGSGATAWFNRAWSRLTSASDPTLASGTDVLTASRTLTRTQSLPPSTRASPSSSPTAPAIR